ncbi:MAG: alpha/beta hydrolase [Flavobacteriales bacterium]|nr:alpha/beta hydrolase [Flavobacteriales bacterium]
MPRLLVHGLTISLDGFGAHACYRLIHNWTMQWIGTLVPALLLPMFSAAQRIETVYLNENDSTRNMYVAVVPETGKATALLVLLGGSGYAPDAVLAQTEIPMHAAQQRVMTVIPVLATGPTSFGMDAASQRSLKEIIDLVVAKYHLKDKDLYVGGFSVGGTCAVRYAELAVQEDHAIKPTAVFAINPPLDWERYYNAANRVVRLSQPDQVNPEVHYMLGRIEQEMNGTPTTALENYRARSPYSFSDTAQTAIRNLIGTPIMIVTEPAIDWWLEERGYDCSYNNITDQSAMINELRKLGNTRAVLVTTTGKGFRKPDGMRHPNSWSIADPEPLITWLRSH